MAGKAALEKVDLEPGLKVLRDQLMTKNVVCMLENHVFIFERDSFIALCVALYFIHMQRAALKIPLRVCTASLQAYVAMLFELLVSLSTGCPFEHKFRVLQVIDGTLLWWTC